VGIEVEELNCTQGWAPENELIVTLHMGTVIIKLHKCGVHLMLQALKKFSFFNKSQNYEDAQEAYTKAGNCFKVGMSHDMVETQLHMMVESTLSDFRMTQLMTWGKQISVVSITWASG
jgi:hypothetical protein